MISVHFQGKPFNIMVIQDYALTSNAEETDVEWFYDDLQDLQEITIKICPLYHSGLESKQESQETPGQTGSLDLVYKMKQGKD